MRIISGKKKGLNLISPSDYSIRPTTDKVKESIFNILYDIDLDSVVLDLFCGSGSVGIEFLSRGAKKVYFCDFNNESLKITKKNIEKANFTENSIILKIDYMEALNYFYTNNFYFDYIFLDPPYDTDYVDNTLDYIYKNNILNKDAIIIIETDKDILIKNFNIIKEKRYSKTKIILLERKDLL